VKQRLRRSAVEPAFIARDAVVVPNDESFTDSEAASRLELQANAGAIWIEFARGEAELPSVFVDKLNADVGAGRYAANVSAPQAMIDTPRRRSSR
jgi:hypothetical protein